MNNCELIRLINVYKKAVDNNNIDTIEKIVKLLPEKIKSIDRSEKDNQKLVGELKNIHMSAMKKIQNEIMIVSSQLNETENSKTRDLAYKKTQLNRTI